MKKSKRKIFVGAIAIAILLVVARVIIVRESRLALETEIRQARNNLNTAEFDRDFAIQTGDHQRAAILETEVVAAHKELSRLKDLLER